MKWFRAVTESGTEYSHTDDSSAVQVIPGPESPGHQDAIKGKMVVIPPEKIAEWSNNKGRLDWEWINSAPNAEVPVIGSHLMVTSLTKWRLSTLIVKIEEK